MAKITNGEIFQAARDVLEEKDVDKARLADVARKLNVSHAALYKHFENKEALFDAMHSEWLDRIDQPILKQAIRANVDEREDKLHDWLQAFLTIREDAFLNDRVMMHYYKLKVAEAPELINERLIEFAEAVERIMAWDTFRSQRGLTVMMAFTYFYHPFFADKWSDNLFQPLFESTWLELLPIIRQELEE